MHAQALADAIMTELDRLGNLSFAELDRIWLEHFNIKEGGFLLSQQ